MGVVYEVDDLERGQRIALKTLKHHDPDTLYRLKREFRVMAHLGHPNLVDLYDLVVDGRSCFVTMELVRGSNFVQHCRAGDAFVEDRLRAALRQLAAGLHTLHQAGMAHRDIKPSNVIVDERNRVVLLDFGLVTEISRVDSLAGRIVGTVEYMAPEQAAGEPPSAAADWYGVGVLLYEVLTGRVPFAGPPMKVLLDKQQQPATPPRALATGVPEDLDALCVDLLARSPAQRPDGDAILARLGLTTPEMFPRASLSSALQRTVFSGRERELETLSLAAADTGQGEATAVVIRGDSGVGKSALLRAFVAAQGERLVAFEGRCYQRENVPYKAMDTIVDQLASYWVQLPEREAAALIPRRAALLRRLFPTLGRVPAIAATPMGPPIHDPHELRTRAFAALREVFVRLADRRTVVLALDDLQWVDADSVTLLSDLLRPPDPPRMLVVLAARSAHGPSELDRLLADLEIRTLSLELEPLTPAAAEEAARALLHGEAQQLARRVAEESGGNPVFIEELALYLQTVETEVVGPISLDEVVDRRLARLPERGRALLELLVTAGEPVSSRVVEVATGQPGEEVSKDLRYLRTALLVRAASGASDRFEPYHDRLHTAVRAHITPDRRRDLHRSLALALERCGEGSSERLARHWHLAGEPERAAELASAAADEAMSTVDFARAARLYQLALSLVEHEPGEERRLRTLLGEALGNSGRATEASEAYLAAAAHADAATRLELRNRAAGELLRSGHIEAGLGALREILAEVDLELAPTQRRALMSALWGRLRLRLRGFRWKARSESDVPHRRLIELDVIASVATSLGGVDTFRAFDFQTRQVLLALQTGEPLRLARALGLDAAFYAAQGKRERALRLADEAERLVESENLSSLPLPHHLWARGSVAYFIDNDWDRAVGLFADTEVELRRAHQSGGWAMNMAQLYGSFARYYRGDYGELARSVPALVREAERRGDRYAGMCYRTRLNFTYLIRDRVDLAERVLRESLAMWPSPDQVGYQVQHYWLLMCRCEIELYRRDPAAAAAAFESNRAGIDASQLRRVLQVGTELLHLEGRIHVQLAHDTADAAARRSHLKVVERCARALARQSRPLPTGFALLLRAGIANIQDDLKGSGDLLLEAIRHLEATRTMAHAAVARRRLGELRGPGDELIRQADRWLAHQRVRNPARLTHMMVPGFAAAEDG